MANLMKSLIGGRDWFGGGSNSNGSSKKSRPPARSQSTDSLCMSLSRRRSSRAKSVESLDDIVHQYEICQSLMELSIATQTSMNPPVRKTSSTRSTALRPEGSRALSSSASMASAGGSGHIKEAWLHDEQRNRKMQKYERKKRRRGHESERNDINPRYKQSQCHTSNIQSPSSYGHKVDVESSALSFQQRSSGRGIGGLSDRKARLELGATYGTSSARSLGTGAVSKDNTEFRAAPHPRRSRSQEDLLGEKMFAKATKAIQEHVKDRTKPSIAQSPLSKQHINVQINDQTTPGHHSVGIAAIKENLYSSNSNISSHNSGYGVTSPANTAISPLAARLLAVPGAQKIYDSNNGVTYIKGRLLGKGGFAKCYEMIDIETEKSYAGKIISKGDVTRSHSRDKIKREVDIHKNLVHKHIVRFYDYFEDNDNMYIILELCNKKSLVNMLRSRKTLTEPEVRYFLAQIIEGTKYMHSRGVIHRDLKLGNMLINYNMHLKIADFGLATRLEYEGEVKLTLCGTPNYIAPEVLKKKGHSYQADIWAMGCIMYALLVGRPPFETSSLKETYHRILNNKYAIPSRVSVVSANLIRRLLCTDPAARPTLDEILKDDFFQHGYMPQELPSSCFNSPFKVPSSYSNTHSVTPSKPTTIKHNRHNSTTPRSKQHNVTPTSAKDKKRSAPSGKPVSNGVSDHVTTSHNDNDKLGSERKVGYHPYLTPSSYTNNTTEVNNHINASPQDFPPQNHNPYITSPTNEDYNKTHNGLQSQDPNCYSPHKNNNFHDALSHTNKQTPSYSEHNYVNVPFNTEFQPEMQTPHPNPPSSHHTVKNSTVSTISNNNNDSITPPELYQSASENNNFVYNQDNNPSCNQHSSNSSSNPSIQRTMSGEGNGNSSNAPTKTSPTKKVTLANRVFVSSVDPGQSNYHSTTPSHITSPAAAPIRGNRSTDIRHKSRSQSQETAYHVEPPFKSSHAQRPKSYADPLSPGDSYNRIHSALASYHSVKNGLVPKSVSETLASPGSNQELPPSSNTRPGSLSGLPLTECLTNVSPIKLHQTLRTFLDNLPKESDPKPERSIRPLWVTKWVDYSNKYGFGFQMSDGSIGVLFNDSTRMIISASTSRVSYNDLSNKVYTFPSGTVPPAYKKKCQLLFYFTQYMEEHLIHGGDIVAKTKAGRHDSNPWTPKSKGNHSGEPSYPSIFMKKWFRTEKAIVMYLSNGTFQVNFFEDHTKIVLSPEGADDYLVTYINSRRHSVTYRLSHIRHHGCRREMTDRLSYAHRMLFKVMNVEEQAV